MRSIFEFKSLRHSYLQHDVPNQLQQRFALLTTRGAEIRRFISSACTLVSRVLY